MLVSDHPHITPHDEAHDGFSVVIDPTHQKPLPAEVVSDRRDTLGRRLAVLGIGLLLLFFAISGYVSSVKNGERLDKALSQGKDQSGLLRTQNEFIRNLEIVIARQALALQKAGLSDQVVAAPSPRPGPPIATPAPKPRGASRAPSPAQHPRASPKPAPRSPRPTPHPSPSPSPTCIVRVGTICVPIPPAGGPRR